MSKREEEEEENNVHPLQVNNNKMHSTRQEGSDYTSNKDNNNFIKTLARNGMVVSE